MTARVYMPAVFFIFWTYLLTLACGNNRRWKGGHKGKGKDNEAAVPHVVVGNIGGYNALFIDLT